MSYNHIEPQSPNDHDNDYNHNHIWKNITYQLLNMNLILIYVFFGIELQQEKKTLSP